MLRRSLGRFFGFLKVQQTPNPDCVSFTIPDYFDQECLLVPEGVSCEASGVGYCDIHPIARALFKEYAKEISAVFIAPRSVSITKYYHVNWDGGVLDATAENFTGISIKQSINTYLSSLVKEIDRPIPPDPDYLLISSLADNDLAVDEEKDSELVQCVKDLLRMQIRPMIMQDGGDIRLLNVNAVTGIVSLHMLGACKSCPSSQNTLKNGIERVLKHFLPEITEVVEVKNPLVTVTKEIEIEVPVVADTTSAQLATNCDSPVATIIKKTFEVSPDDFEPVHKNEASLYREIMRLDNERQIKLRRDQVRRRGSTFMTFEDLVEPDGD